MAAHTADVIDELMAEHRVVERVIADMALEIKHIRTSGTVDAEYLDTVTDFLSCYADRGHHGKEEDLLLLSLVSKQLPDHLESQLRMLVDDHIWARATTRALFAASQRYAAGDTDAVEHVVEPLAKIVEYYPRHFAKEEDGFFRECMEQFTPEEREDLRQRFRAFSGMYPFHARYAGTVQALEARRSAQQAG